MIGYKGSGLLLGVGTLSGDLGYEIGLQVSQKWWFLNLGYGVYGVATNMITEERQLLAGFIGLTGGKINLNKSKRIFLELGIGYAGGDSVDIPGREGFSTGGLSGVIGLGCRLGGISKLDTSPAE